MNIFSFLMNEHADSEQRDGRNSPGSAGNAGIGLQVTSRMSERKLTSHANSRLSDAR